jgi:hypothetical protein
LIAIHARDEEVVPARELTVDFVVRGDEPDEWKLVLIEEGPWEQPIDAHLRRLQTRLYDSIDAALDGQLAGKFPDSLGKRITIALDCYNCPREEVADFFARFSDAVLETPHYMSALKKSKFVSDIGFKLTLETIS